MAKKKSRLILICILAIIFTFIIWFIVGYCNLRNIYTLDNEFAVPANLPQGTIQQIKARRNELVYDKHVEENSLVIEKKIQNTQYNYQDDLYLSELIRSTPSMRNLQYFEAETITIEQLEEELRIIPLFYLYTYPGVTIDGTFDSLNNACDMVFNELTSKNSEKAIEVFEYRELLRLYILPILNDNHAHIAGTASTDYIYSSFMSKETFVYLDGNYIITLNGIDYKFALENTERMASFASEKGTIEYRIVYHQENSKDSSFLKSCSFIPIGEHDSIMEIDIEFIPLSNNSVENLIDNYILSDETYLSTFTENYTYLKISELNDENTMNKMINEAKNIPKDRPIIIDLRDNTGGGSQYITKWLLSYKNISQIQYINYTIPVSIYEVKSMTSEAAYGNRLYKKFDAYINSVVHGDYQAHIKNDAPIYILFDRETVSSGEWWISYFQRMDNVVFVGENSSGTQIGGNNRFINLPYSSLKISSSSIMCFDNDFKSYENIGLEPDIYCESAKTLDFVLGLISN